MSRGFSTLEILLALTIMTTTLAAVALVQLGVPGALVEGTKEISATRAASALLNKSFEEGLSDFKDVQSVGSTTLNDTTVSLTVAALPDGFTKYLTTSAEWQNIEGNERFITLHGFVTDYAKVLQTSSCSDVLSGDWTHPVEHTFTLSAGGLLPSSSSLVHPISTLTTSNSMLVAGVGTTTTKTDPSLFIFDISSTTQPEYLSSIDNATSTKQGVNAIAISGTYLFVANASTPNFGTCKAGAACSQLQVFDLGIPSAPVDIQNLELSTTTAPFAIGSGGQAIGKSIAYANGYIYLGLTKSGNANGDEFNIIDVRNPRSPLWLGGFSVGRSVNKIIVRGSYAYLATDDPTRELLVLDVHDPTNITMVGSYDAPGASTFGYGNDLALEGTLLSIGRTYTPNGPELSILSVASTAPQMLSSELIGSTLNPVNVQAVLVRDFLLFVLSNTSLELFDIHNPAQPIQYATPLSLPMGSTGNALACRENTLYLGSIGNNQTGYLTTITGS